MGTGEPALLFALFITVLGPQAALRTCCLPVTFDMCACTRAEWHVQSCCFARKQKSNVRWGSAAMLRSLKRAVLGVQLLVQQVPEAIDRIIFLDAVILKTGESFALNKIGWPAQVAPASMLPSLHCSQPYRGARIIPAQILTDLLCQ